MEKKCIDADLNPEEARCGLVKLQRQCDTGWRCVISRHLSNDEKDVWQALASECQPICLSVFPGKMDDSSISTPVEES